MSSQINHFINYDVMLMFTIQTKQISNYGRHIKTGKTIKEQVPTNVHLGIL